jgi:lipopolysaccharide biosynthesis protein
LGLLVCEPFFFDLLEPAKHFGNTQWLNLLLARMSEEQMIGNYDFRFPAGSMFWFRMAALPQLLDEEFVSIDEFEFEAGQLNGTLAHAIERIVGLIPLHNQFAVDMLADKEFDEARML